MPARFPSARGPRRASRALLSAATLATFIALAPACSSVPLEHAPPLAPPASSAPVREDVGGWIVLHLAGSPADIGYQHGSAIAPEIDDAIKAVKFDIDHNKDGYRWPFYRDAVKSFMLSRIDREYMDELNGIVRGLRSRGFSYDVVDLIVLNAYLELTGYYAPAFKARQDAASAGATSPAPTPASAAPERCSAFVATGSATQGGRPVIGHNMWDGYITGQRINVILDVRPARGHRFVMDTMPGMIHSGTDFAINDAGIAYTETTISDFEGFREDAVPEFVRARKAAQYAASLDDFYRIMRENNNGGYANAWLVADIWTGEIGKLELGLKNIIFHRTFDGAYFGANYPEDAKLAAEECPDYDPRTDDCEVRRERWTKVLADNKGKVNAELGKAFLGDTVNARTGTTGATGSTLCGRSDLDPDRGYRCGGATNAKVADAAMASHLTFWARMGFPDGSTFNASEYLAGRGKDNDWMRPMLKDIPAQPWVVVGASTRSRPSEDEWSQREGREDVEGSDGPALRSLLFIQTSSPSRPSR